MMLRYWRERFAIELFVPTASLLALAAVAAGSGGLIDWCVDTVLALLLLAQFRLWDDLADRERDRLDHPTRVLVTVEATASFVALTLVLGTINLLLVQVFAGPLAARGLLALDAGAAAYYLLRSAGRTAAGDLLLLAKYPAFVAILAGSTSSPLRLCAAAGVTYGAACAFEVWHDASCPLRVQS